MAMPGEVAGSMVLRRGERWARRGRAALLAPIVIVLLAPSFVVIPMSFSKSLALSWPPQGFTLAWYGKLFGSDEWLASAGNSVEVALAATVLALALGVPAGLAFGLRDWPGKQMALALVVVPLVVPTIVVAIGMYEVYALVGLVDIWGLAAAHAAIGVPFVVITAMSAARQLNPVLLLAARSLGARPLSVFLHVTLPGVALGVLSGAVFAFVTSWDEVVIANFLTTPTFQTIPVQMWNQLTESVDPTVAAMATSLFAVTTSLMFGLLWLRRSRA
jgi:putative spermidine/putrescine transport system permease protein